jgi:hypothetical protein
VLEVFGMADRPRVHPFKWRTVRSLTPTSRHEKLAEYLLFREKRAGTKLNVLTPADLYWANQHDSTYAYAHSVVCGGRYANLHGERRVGYAYRDPDLDEVGCRGYEKEVMNWLELAMRVVREGGVSKGEANVLTTYWQLLKEYRRRPKSEEIAKVLGIKNSRSVNNMLRGNQKTGRAGAFRKFQGLLHAGEETCLEILEMPESKRRMAVIKLARQL